MPSHKPQHIISLSFFPECGYVESLAAYFETCGVSGFLFMEHVVATGSYKYRLLFEIDTDAAPFNEDWESIYDSTVATCSQNDHG